MWITLRWLIAAAAIFVSGCAANRSAKSEGEPYFRNQQLAAELTHRAADLIGDDPAACSAERWMPTFIMARPTATWASSI